MKISAGLMMYKVVENEIKIYLVHHGGPYYEDKDDGYWGIPKGEVEGDEEFVQTAIREFAEETGLSQFKFYHHLVEIQERDGLIPLECVRAKSGKVIYAWAFEGDILPEGELKGNMFEMEWPLGSGKKQHFPEVDKGQFFSVDEAKVKIRGKQVEFIDRLTDVLSRKN